MRKILILSLLSLHGIYAFSQCVSIQLSIEWRREKQLLSNDSDFRYNPYLNISYQNHANIPIYFLKPSVSHLEFPKFTKGSPKYYSNNFYSSNYKKIIHHNYFKNRYKVEISGSPYYGSVWEVFPDTANIMKEHEMNIINDDLSDIYEYISYKKDSIKYLANSSYFEYKSENITENGILAKLKENFCFLNVGEVLTESYNLIGFQIIKGSFDFNFSANCLYGYVYSDSFWNIKKKRWSFRKTALPKIVNHYKLYHGKFNSNSINIKFN